MPAYETSHCNQFRFLSVCVLLCAAGAVSQPALRGDSPADANGFVLVQAEDRTACPVEGSAGTYLYPRTVGRTIAILHPESRLTTTTELGNISIILPPVFESPGPRYGNFLQCRLRVRVESASADRAASAQPWRELALATARAETIVAENLPPGKHTITVEPIGGVAVIDAFRFAKEPMAGLSGTITTRDYSELLTDVRVDVYEGDRQIRTEYVRQPRTGGFEVFGLAAGNCRVRIRAAGWEDETLADLKIRGPGHRLDVGTIVLKRDLRCGGSDAQERLGPRFGQTVCVTPGGSFRTLVGGLSVLAKAQLRSRFKTIDIAITSSRMLPEVGRLNDLAEATFDLPKNIPSDMYDLVLSYGPQPSKAQRIFGQAVCVREALPAEFHLAGCGHMNTWGQQTAEYLARVAEMAELAGARTLLVANEVNAAYICGALADLRIPYVVTQGNHTMARWHEFFGPASQARDDGPMRIVDFGRWPYESWQEVDALFRARPQATNRVLVCYESFAPLSLVREHELDLLFDGHSDDNHPLRGKAPPRTFMMRAPDQESLRWIPMTRDGVAPAAKTNADIPVLPIPRTGPAPLRASFEFANDGSAAEQTARITNDLATEFPRARLRLVLRRGAYRIVDAKVLQAFDSDDGARTILDLETPVAAKSTRVVRAAAK